jgi:Tol biopolymer transport system component/ribosomal protein S11
MVLLFSCSEEKITDDGKGIVKGRVVKETTFEPLENVRISSNPNTSVVFTDAQGNFTINDVPSGAYSFEARKDGFVAKFEAITVTNENTVEIVYELKVSTAGNIAPTVPVLTSPVDNAVNQNLSLNLTWTTTDADADPITATVILRNDVTDAVQTFENITTNSLTVSNLNYSTKYFWQVVVSDGIAPLVYSPISSFRTKVFPDARFLYSRKIESNSVIFTADLAGNELQLTSSNKNSYRPLKNLQSSKIAFIQSDGSQNHIYTMNFDGSNLIKVTNVVPIAGFNFDYVKFAWKNNGSQIIYPNFDKLYRINADGSGLTEIFQTPNGKFITECDWSFDGSVIVVKVNDSNGYNVELYTINTSGTVLTQILSGINGAVNGLHLSANNQKLVYTRDISGFENGNYRQLDSRIYMYNFTTGNSTEVPVERPSGFNDLDVRFSPNEADLIFVNTSNDGISQRNIQKFTMGLINSRQTLFQNCVMPDWK